MVVATLGQLARMQRHGHDEVEVGSQAGGVQLGAVELAEGGAHVALALVLELVEQVLHPAVAHKAQVAQGMANGQFSPKAPAQRILLGRQPVKIGVGQFGPATGAQVVFTRDQRLAAGQTEAWKNQANKIGRQGAEQGSGKGRGFGE